MNDLPATLPRVWHLPLLDSQAETSGRQVVVGRQGIFQLDLSLLGYELLFRAPGRLDLRIDLWNNWQQDRATEHVLAAAFFHGEDLAGGLPCFINVTASYVLDPSHYLHPPREIILEVVESAHSDRALRDRLSELKDSGYRIAIDDFVGTTSQRDLLPLADFVKIDMRDFLARGQSLVDVARGSHAQLIAERIETEDHLAECVAAGFEYFQGHFFEAAMVIDCGLAAVS